MEESQCHDKFLQPGAIPLSSSNLQRELQLCAYHRLITRRVHLLIRCYIHESER